MAKISRSDQPVWQQNAIFQFFASLKLAVVLLAVLIAGAIVGTLYESSFDAKVARTYVYGAPWFNTWLVLLGANLTVSALSRWPWKKYHGGFLITHLGIITLLIGSLVMPRRSEEHTSELQSQSNLVCRLLLEKKKKK